MLSVIITIENESKFVAEQREVAFLAALDHSLKRPEAVVDCLEATAFRRHRRRYRGRPIDALSPPGIEVALRAPNGLAQCDVPIRLSASRKDDVIALG